MITSLTQLIPFRDLFHLSFNNLIYQLLAPLAVELPPVRDTLHHITDLLIDNHIVVLNNSWVHTNVATILHCSSLTVTLHIDLDHLPDILMSDEIHPEHILLPLLNKSAGLNVPAVVYL